MKCKTVQERRDQASFGRILTARRYTIRKKVSTEFYRELRSRVLGQIALEVINDFLNAFKMDYTSSIFVHEGNLKDPSPKSELAKKLNLGDYNEKEPILFQMIKALTSGNVKPQRYRINQLR